MTDASGSTTRHRHPSDVARLVFALVLLGVLLLVEAIAPRGVLDLSTDLLALVGNLPEALRDGLVGLVQLAATVVPVVVAVVLLKRRDVALLFILLLAAVIAAVCMALLSGLVQESVPLDGLEGASSWFIGSQYPSATYVAALTAALVAASPWLPRAWRVAGWSFILAVLSARILSATEVPLRSGLLLALGAASGSAALLVFGAPRRRIDPASVAAAIDQAGLGDVTVTSVDDAGVDPLYRVDPADGEPFLAKVLGRDQRDADLLLASWRALTVKGLGDPGAIRSPERAVAREAVAMAVFDAAEVTVPTTITVLTTADEAAVLGMTALPGRALASLSGEDVGDAALRDAFRQVARLQRRRLAHRSLDGDNILVEGDRVGFVNLRRANRQVTDEELGADLADLLTTIALVVGTERTVGAARAELSLEELGRAVPLIQPAVLTRVTRRAVRALDDGDDFLRELRDAAADTAELERVELTPVQRITVGGAVSLVGSIVLVGYVFSLAADWEQIWDSFTTADTGYLLPLLALGMVPYFTGALSMLGAVPIDLGFVTTTQVMFAQSFLNRFTPANAGGMAMRVRYLQLNGLDAPVAATSIGLTSAASGVAQGLMIVVFLIWGGASDRFSDFEGPDIGGIVVAMLAIGLLAGVGLTATQRGRDVVRPWLTQVAARIRATLGELFSDPKKMSQLFGGAVLGKLANILAFWMTTLAFEVDISFPKAGAIYMVASSIGSAVPTPGGVGGVEAALTAALLSYGVGSAPAASIVLLFRLMTFWIPTIPGYVFLQITRRRGIV